MLSRSMVQQGLYDQGRFVVIYPAQNNNCDAAVNLYQSHLISGGPSVSGFDCLTLETCLDAIRDIGDAETASALHKRYLNFGRVEKRSEEHTSEIQSLMRNSYAVFCLTKKKKNQQN